MKICLGALFLPTLVVAMCSGALQASSIAPFYPAQKSVEYVCLTIPEEQISVTLDNGVLVNVGNELSEQSLNGTWKCSGLTNSAQAFDKSVDVAKGYASENFNDSTWDSIAVPLNWYVKYPATQRSDSPYVKGWYRRSIIVPADKQGGSVVLDFGVIGYEADLYINGNFAGTHHGDFTPWDVDITRLVKFGSTNTIAIQVLSDFGPKNGVSAPAKHAYGSQWGMGDIKGGIWQDTSIRYSPSIYVKRILISPNVSGSSVKVEYTITNNTSARKIVRLSGVVQSAMTTDSTSQAANVGLGTITLSSGDNSGSVNIALANPHQWTPDDPYLYYFILAATDSSNLVTASAERFGFREFKAIGKYFYLNGKRIYLFGENMASNQYGGYGRDSATEYTSIINNLLAYKSKGYNIIRMAHMPAIKSVYDLADEIGIMLYDEWAWAFTTSIDSTSFETNDLAEVREWVYRDYNHPSVVMWSCGNEINYTGNTSVYNMLNKQVQLVRSLDSSGRPVSSFSGAAFDFGTNKLDTDVLDLHRYLGTGGAAWTRCDADFTGIYDYDKAVYGSNSALSIPFVIWECIGLSWGNVSDTSYMAGNVDKYAQYATKPTSWEEPNGIGFAGLIGLAAALDPNRGSTYAQAIYGRHILELIRYYDNVAGFAPWYLAPGLDAATLWTQPTYCGLRVNTGIPPKHFFSARSYQPSLFIINSCNSYYANVTLNIVLVGTDGSQRVINTYDFPSLAAWEKKEQQITIDIPANTNAGQYQIRLILNCSGQEISRNFYDVFVQSPSIATSAIATNKSIAVLKAQTTIGKSFESILSSLNINATSITDIASLSSYNVLIIPPSSAQDPLIANENNRQALMRWVSSGGILLCLEQNYDDASLLGGTLKGAETSFVDLVVPGHPIFNGLIQDNFDAWDNPYCGFVITRALSPFTTNALAARCPFQGGSGVMNAVSEGTYGSGRILTSQLEATSLWNIDSVATTYMHNLLSYALSSSFTTSTRSWQLESPIIPPSASTISCNKTPGVWYNTPDFAYSAIGGFSIGTISKYIFAWDNSTAHRSTTNHYMWDAGALLINARSPGIYYLHVCGLNSTNIITGSFDYGPFYYDNIPPQNPVSGIEINGVANDTWQSQVATPSFTWSPGVDDMSGIAGYNVYFGPDITGTSTTFMTSSSLIAQLQSTGTYYLRIRAKDNAGNYATSWSTLFTFKYDATPPSVPVVSTDGPYSGSKTIIHARWSASSDAQSGIAEYLYAVGTSSGASDIFNWTSAGMTLKNKIFIPSPGLVSGHTYYVSVKAKNLASLLSSSGTSNGIKVIEPSPSIAAVKSIEDGNPVALAGKAVSAVFSDRFYIEEANRTSGIAVMGQGAEPGVIVTVAGIIGTNQSRERIILSPTVTIEDETK